MSEESNTIIDGLPVESTEPEIILSPEPPEEIRWISVGNDIVRATGERLAEILLEEQKTPEEKLAERVSEIDHEKFLNTIRNERRGLLGACDWTQSSDSPLTDAKKAEWATYRQQLRDFTSRTFVGLEYFVIPWPQKPE